MTLHRRLSVLNAHPLFKSHGVEMLCRATEYGTITLASPWPRVPGTESGVPFVHIHAHVVYRLEHQLSRRRWKRFRRKVRNLWRHIWGDNGRLENIREACKYPIKPGDYSHLTNAHVAAFYHATKGLHLVQPLGAFREEIASRRDACLKLVRLRNADGELELRAKPDWNARIDRLTPAEKAARAAFREQERRRGFAVCIRAAALLAARDEITDFMRNLVRGYRRRRMPVAIALILVAADACAVELAANAETLVGFTPRPFEETRESGRQKLAETAKSQKAVRPMRNRIVARCAPAPYFDEVTRPAFFVAGFDGDYDALKNQPFVREVLDAVRPQIQRAEAAVPNLRVHTSHTTVGNEIPLLNRAETWRETQGVGIKE